MKHVLAIALQLTLAACHGGDGVEPCTSDGSCDDDDPCTDDRCLEGRCVAIPTGAEEACRTDNHCDDGIACSVDACAIDGCGFMRCTNTFGDDCDRCEAFSDCDDDVQCTADVCRGVCVHVESADCDLRADMLAADPEPGMRLEGLVTPEYPCACPCTTAARFSGHRLTGDSEPSCTIACGASGDDVSCHPIPFGPTWIVVATALDGWKPLSWAMSPKTLRMASQWQGEITWPESATTTRFVGTTDTDGVWAVPAYAQAGGAPQLVGAPVRRGAFDAFPTRFVFEATHEGFARELHALLYPTAVGFAGPVLSDDLGAPISGRIELVWVAMLTPDEAR